MTANRITWTGYNTAEMRAFCDRPGDQRLFLHNAAGGVPPLAEVVSGGRWVPLSHGDVIVRGASDDLTVERPQPEARGSGSPHAADARDKLQEAQETGNVLAALRALTNAALAIGEELEETRRTQDSRQIDMLNVLATIAGHLKPRELVYAEYRPTWRDRMRVLFRGTL